MLPFVETQFVDTGKVEVIFLDLPLQKHPYAFKAAEAAACAGDQKKFWEMHDHLFANQGDLAPERLPIHAEKLGLDVAAFQKCLSSGRSGAGIREDMRAAQILGITGTPAYLIGRRLAGSEKVEILEVVKGLPPYEDLEEKLNGFLASGSPTKQ